MKRIAFVMCAVLCAAIAPRAEAQSGASLPVEAFGNLPVIADAAISPDGSKVVLAQSVAGEPLVNIFSVDDNRSVFRARLGAGAELRDVGWADDRFVTYQITRAFRPGEVLPITWRFRGSPTRVLYRRNGIIDLQSQETRLLTTNEDASWHDMSSTLVSPIEGDPGFGRLLGASSDENSARLAIYRVNFENGHADQQNNLPGVAGDTRDIVLDERGVAVVRIDAAASSNRWRVFTYDGARPRLLLEDVSEIGDAPDVQGLLPDGRLAVLGDDNAYTRLWAVSLADGQRSMLSEQSSFDVAGAIHDPWTRRVVGYSWTEDEPKQRFFEADLQNIYQRAGDAFGQYYAVTLLNWSRDRQRFIVFADNGLDGGGFYLFSAGDNSVRMFGMRYPAVAAARFSERQAITFPARDGVRIPGYLTLPEGQSRNLPLVLLVHGGPHARDTMEFDYMASFFASRGYAVLQPNFRGSSGYGAAWERAGYGQWGGLMQTDVEDAVASLSRAGIADPNRVCIVGGSYGGYAALAGATLTPDRYACAISVNGVSDLNQWLAATGLRTGQSSVSSDFWRRSIGDRSEDSERIRSVSPVNLASNVHIPVLIIHGVDDTVVPIEHSRRMRDRLVAAGKEVRYVELAGDDHWLSDAPTRIQTLREMESFLSAHLAPAH